LCRRESVGPKQSALHGAVVLALLMIDPPRDLTLVFVPLALAVGLVLAARWMPGS